MTMVLPPEKVNGLAGGMNSHLVGSLDFQVRRTIFGQPCVNTFNCMGSTYNPNQMEFVKHTMDIYKEYVRPYAKDGLIFHHTPECCSNYPRGVAILERSAQNGECGILGIFGLCDFVGEAVIVYPKGLDVSANYEITFDNSGAKAVVSGYSLANEGVRARMDASLSTELLIYKKI